MTLPAKTRFLDLFRRVFKHPLLEGALAHLVFGRPIEQAVCKLVPGHYLYPTPSVRVLERDGLRMKLDLSDYIDHSLFFGFRGTEDESYRRLLALIEPTHNCIDVGTKNGYLSLRMSRLAHKGRTLGFEPDPGNYRQTLENLELNPTGNLAIRNTGLGDRPCEARMEMRSAGNSGGNRIANGGDAGAAVKIDRLDDVLAEIGFGPVSLIKVDVEGYELKVLRGSERTLRSFKPLLFVEVDDANLRHQGDSAAALIAFLRDADYDDIRHAATGDAVDARHRNLHFDLIAR